MFTKTKTTTMVLAALASLVAVNTTQAQFHYEQDDYKHIDRLAYVLEKQTKVLHKQIHAFFRLTPSYKHLDKDVFEMEKLVRHIHDVVHKRGSVKHLRSDVEKLDKLFHHIEDLTYGMVKTRRISWQTYVTFRVTLSGIGRTLHLLRDDLRHMDFHGHNYHGHYGFPY